MTSESGGGGGLSSLLAPGRRGAKAEVAAHLAGGRSHNSRAALTLNFEFAAVANVAVVIAASALNRSKAAQAAFFFLADRRMRCSLAAWLAGWLAC